MINPHVVDGRPWLVDKVAYHPHDKESIENDEAAEQKYPQRNDRNIANLISRNARLRSTIPRCRQAVVCACAPTRSANRVVYDARAVVIRCASAA